MDSSKFDTMKISAKSANKAFVNESEQADPIRPLILQMEAIATYK
jgi:hypothetical protein